MAIGPKRLLQAQSAAISPSVVQKSVNTGGGVGESMIRWVRRIPVSCAFGSEYQEVPYPPSQPKRPGAECGSSRPVKTDRPKPQPLALPRNNCDSRFWSATIWFVVIIVMDSRDNMRALPRLPPLSIIRANALKSSAVETRPAAPFSNSGGFENLPVTGGSKTFNCLALLSFI